MFHLFDTDDLMIYLHSGLSIVVLWFLSLSIVHSFYFGNIDLTAANEFVRMILQIIIGALTIFLLIRKLLKSPKEK